MAKGGPGFQLPAALALNASNLLMQVSHTVPCKEDSDWLERDTLAAWIFLQSCADSFALLRSICAYTNTASVFTLCPTKTYVKNVKGFCSEIKSWTLCLWTAWPPVEGNVLNMANAIITALKLMIKMLIVNTSVHMLPHNYSCLFYLSFYYSAKAKSRVNTIDVSSFILTTRVYKFILSWT